jgi:pimeloyl-ACP methyl ester carboxylesterase
MNHPVQISGAPRAKSCVVALHCSLGSGRQWSRLTEQLGAFQVIAPDLSGYGSQPRPINPPMTLAEEVALLRDRLDQAAGPIHLVGHSYGGAVAFKMATQSPFANRVRSLTLIEPVLPTLLKESAADRRLYERFAELAQRICQDVWKGSLMEAVDKFVCFWTGSAPREKMSPAAQLRLIEQIEKVAFDFTAAFAETDVTARAAAIRVPTLLISGGLSPYITQRIVGKLASLIVGAQTRHLPSAGHMLPVPHADEIYPDIVGHIRHAEQHAQVFPAFDLVTVPKANPLEHSISQA